MSRRAEDRAPRTGAATDHLLRLAWIAPSGASKGLLADPTVHARTTGHDAPRRQRSDREREANRRLERAEEIRAAKRLARPTAPEQQMMSVFATLGERYGDDYLREYKIMDGDWYVTHVDFCVPDRGLAVEVYGGPHYKPALDRTGTRQEDDRQRIREFTAAGWTVLIVEDTALTQARWSDTVEIVRAFLDQDQGPARRTGR